MMIKTIYTKKKVKSFFIVFIVLFRYNDPVKKKRVLIIRSVSFQQLDKNVVRVKEMFPGAEFYLLTHSHGVNRARKYEMLSDVFDYRSRKNFSFFFIPRRLKGERFDAVVVPVTNKTGAGFLNVFLLALRLKGIKPGKIYCCNLVSEVWHIPGRKIVFQAGRSFFFSAAALVLGFVSLPIIPVLLLISLLFGKKRELPG